MDVKDSAHRGEASKERLNGRRKSVASGRVGPSGAELSEFRNSPGGLKVRDDAQKTNGLGEHEVQSQAMIEDVGGRAAGLAHDVGNLLTAIMGCSELVLNRLEDGDPLRLEIQEIKEGAGRAAELTRQLLANHSGQKSEPQLLDVNAVLADTQTMLRRLLGGNIELVTRLDPCLGRVEAVRAEIEQVVMNLVLNARDAMASGGTLTVETSNVEPCGGELRDGSGGGRVRYVLLAVGDTGCGMAAEVQSHIFEPFFTTKPAGKNTGLGLSTVQRIVARAGGCIRLDTAPGRGATFKVYLPWAGEAASPAPLTLPLVDLPRGTETILLVEDDHVLRRLTRAILERSGYRVLPAVGGREALETCEQHGGPIDAVVTDVVMPEMSGRDLADRLLRLRPRIKVLFTSGCAADVVDPHTLQSGRA